MLYFQLYFEFLRIGLFTFGGGYAMLPIMIRVIAEKRKWVSHSELTDYFALGQIFPGVLAVNTSIFVGIKQKGFLGGLCASLGMITPSLIVIMLVATFFETFVEIEIIRNAFSGVLIAACALIVLAVYKIFRQACLKTGSSVKLTMISLAMFKGAFGAILFGVSPIIVVLITALAGVLFTVFVQNVR
ncbi:MAG: chromate transporter [Oscillospiraceae bacterium]|nr:chromate transporter [Oscillospiraceae bacterium]